MLHVLNSVSCTSYARIRMSMESELKQGDVNNEVKKGSAGTETRVADIFAERLSDQLEKKEQEEQKPDMLNLLPNVAFVERHLDIYQKGLDVLLARKNQEMDVDFELKGSASDGQIPVERIKALLQAMPDALKSISHLKNVVYYNLVIVPVLNQDGAFESAEFVPLDDFPREQDHPSRVMVGSTTTDGQISMVPIPATVSENARAVSFYQDHVFLHEFFHTLENARRSPTLREEIVFASEGREFSFQEWWQDFEELILSGREPKFVSRYAQSYAADLTQEVKAASPDKFTHALAEQICECFVAYCLNIISNDEGWTDFKKETFGNSLPLHDELDGAMNEKWRLMDRLWNATLVRVGE